MRKVTIRRPGALLAAAIAVALLPSAGQAAVAGGPSRARITGRPLPGQPISAPAVTGGLPSKKQQIKVLVAALARMRKNYAKLASSEPGPVDILDYNIGSLWRRGIDGAGTTVAVIEGWDYPPIAKVVAGFDRTLGLPNPRITTIFPSDHGKLPAKCPAGMVELGSYGSCSAWGGELALDVLSAHLIAPYAKIVISVTPADSEIADDAASQVAPPEMMEALERISRQHLANVISISDGQAEGTFSHGPEEITAQDPGELSAAAAGIPVLVATGDCDVVQALPENNAPCTKVTAGPSTAAWADSPWVTAMGGAVPDFSSTGKRLGADPVWNVGPFGEGAGFSAVFARPAYQDGVARITRSAMRSVPDLSMDSSDGTSEAGPLMAGALALATQLNHGNVGPVNPVLYHVLGPDRQRGRNRRCGQRQQFGDPGRQGHRAWLHGQHGLRRGQRLGHDQRSPVRAEPGVGDPLGSPGHRRPRGGPRRVVSPAAAKHPALRLAHSARRLLPPGGTRLPAEASGLAAHRRPARRKA